MVVPRSLAGRVSRRDIALDRRTWLAQAAMFAILAASAVSLALGPFEFQTVRLLVLAAGLALVAVIFLVTSPQPVDSVGNHLAVASSYVGTGAGMYAFAPQTVAVVSAIMFAGPLAATRLVDRRQISGHLLLATAFAIAPAIYAHANSQGMVGLATLIIGVWVLGGCCAFVLETAEAQGEELEHMVLRDPLTGVGNRRMFTEQLTRALRRHQRFRRPLTLLLVDLDDFKQLNDKRGYAAGDELIQRVAATLVAAAPAKALVTRTRGDRFAILLPEVSFPEAEGVVAVVRGGLLSCGVTAAFGVASFPRDAVHDKVLVQLAEQRMSEDQVKAEGEPRPATLGNDHDPVGSVTAAASQREGSGLRRISRRDLAENTMVWRATAAMLGIGGTATVATIISGGEDRSALLLFLGCVVGTGVAVWLMPPPPTGSLRNHFAVAITYLITACGLFAFQPSPGVALAFAIFVGPLAAVRLDNRRALFSHLVAASLLFAVSASIGGLLGALNQATLVAVLLSTFATWCLGISCLLTLEAVEAQGDDLERLVRCDPLTGVGNRRMLIERLDEEIGRHLVEDQQLSVVVLDVTCSGGLGEALGRAATDELVRRAAVVLVGLVAPRDVVVRQGDQFWLIVVETSATDAVRVCDAVTAGLGSIEIEGHSLTARLGLATFPQDAATRDGLLEVASRRLTLEGRSASE